MKIIIAKLLFITLSLFCASASADWRPFLSGQIGYASAEEKGFDRSDYYVVSAGQHFDQFAVLLSYIRFKSFESERILDTEIESSAYALGIGKHFNLGQRVSIDLYGGVYFWDSEAEVLGLHSTDDSGNDLWIRPRFSLITKHYTMFFSSTFYRDLSDSDIKTFSIGLDIHLGRF